MDKDKSGKMAHHGSTGPAEEKDKDETNINLNGNNERLQLRDENNHRAAVLHGTRNSSDTISRQYDQQYNAVGGCASRSREGERCYDCHLVF